MDSVLRLGLQSMHEGASQLDRISQNMANALTPGYRREAASVRAMNATAESFGAAVDGLRSTALRPSELRTRQELVHTDFSVGALKPTGQSLDLALTRSGFFEVMTPDGPAYTRHGSFHLDARGRLVTVQGHPVMGKSGEIVLQGGTPKVDQAGRIHLNDVAAGTGSALGVSTQHSQEIAQLKIVAAPDSAQLRRIGDGLFTADVPLDAAADADVQIKQGYVENSNVNTMREMVDLIQTMRHVEAMQKMVQGYDDITGQAIKKLGELS